MRKQIVAGAILLTLGACATMHRDPIGWGRELAQANCAACHAIGPSGDSPNPFAPAFRDVHKLYDFEHVVEDLAGNQINGHPPMPSFAMRPGDLRDLIAYIRSQQPPSGHR